MEGKAVLFQSMAGVEAFPICLAARDPDEIVRIVAAISPSFGGINLEDISAPRCFEIERRLRELLDMPVFHDDQHGTAIVVTAALLNGMKLRGCTMSEVRTTINGAGAAGIAVAKLHYARRGRYRAATARAQFIRDAAVTWTSPRSKSRS